MSVTAIGLAFVLALWIAAMTLERPPERPCGEAVRVRAVDIIEP